MALKGMVVVEDTYLSWDSDFAGQTAGVWHPRNPAGLQGDGQ